MSANAYLQGWKLFCDKRRSVPSFVDKVAERKLNRFRARFMAAVNFKALVMENAFEKLVRGYSAGVRLLLAYSAAETLGNAIGSDIKTWTLSDSSLIEPIRNICGSYDDDQDGLDSPKLRMQLASFVSGNDDNLRVAATALRVLMAHGHFAPSNAVYTRRHSDAVVHLSNLLLQESQRHFVAWLEHKIEATVIDGASLDQETK